MSRKTLPRAVMRTALDMREAAAVVKKLGQKVADPAAPDDPRRRLMTCRRGPFAK